jgi:hypothetical protein
VAATTASRVEGRGAGHSKTSPTAVQLNYIETGSPFGGLPRLHEQLAEKEFDERLIFVGAALGCVVR